MFQLAQCHTDRAATNFEINMKSIICLCAVLAIVLARPEDSYSTKYDDFNAQDLVDNLRLLKSYGKCFLEKGPCTPEGHDFKKTIPDALKSECGKCTPKQRQLIRTVVRGFKAKLPEVWEELVKKYDPENQHSKAFNNFINGSD